MVEDKSSVSTEKNIGKPSKKILFVFIFVFILGISLVFILFMTLDNLYAILDSGTRFSLIWGMIFGIIIVVIGGVGIILYFIAPDKLNKFINWIADILTWS